ncbi:MAG TPA: hypothetical protein PKK69_01885 [Ferruginibacter sp.]|nr:hypothetical protein [Ferruginibacter sp.]
MALEEFEEEDKLTERDKGFIRMRSIMDFGMGTLWIAMGVFLIFIKHFNTGLEARFDDPVMKGFGAVCILYGLFRLYRGYQKQYLR